MNCKNGDSHALAKIHENMQAYCELLRAHIDKENNILFRMADNVLSESEQNQLLEEFARIEANDIAGGGIQIYQLEIIKLEAVINEL